MRTRHLNSATMPPLRRRLSANERLALGILVGAMVLALVSGWGLHSLVLWWN